MAAFSPLAFAVAQASTHDYGLLFIETSNAGTSSRYWNELSELGDDVNNVLASHDVAIVTEISLAEAKAKFAALVVDYDEGSCLSIAAIFIKPNGHIADGWYAGQSGKDMSDDQYGLHASL